MPQTLLEAGKQGFVVSGLVERDQPAVGDRDAASATTRQQLADRARSIGTLTIARTRGSPSLNASGARTSASPSSCPSSHGTATGSGSRGRVNNTALNPVRLQYAVYPKT